ncbi:internal virion protein with endolysin domain [Phage MedPE-SWcel-C56]|uniref:Internal virion protein n=1 Tax=Phage MedPE-SWcel-C56 TaxID=1871314 RepID=A0A1B1IY56_9CAUD|nr:internal virion protein with endolysin domain [Phage MedPE-SWcel-C56]ANS06237.1 hypothetical protein [Phage MedPE-SWcel-C56]
MPENFMIPLEDRPSFTQDVGALPNSQRAREIDSARAQRGVVDNVVAGVKDTAAADVLNFLNDELKPLAAEDDWNPMAHYSGLDRLILGERAGGEADFTDQFETLTKGVPSQYHEEILGQPNAEAAARARARIDGQLARAAQAGKQHGFSSNLAMIAGSFVDIDAPLMLMTGGGYKAAVASRKALQLSRRVGLSAKGAMRMSSAAVGANAGLQAGLVVGAAQAGVRETADWTLVAESALQGMILGAAANPLLGGDVKVAAKAAQDELYARVARDDASLYDAPDVNPANAETQGPVVFEEPAGSTVGAQQVNPGQGPVVPKTPMEGNLSDTVKAWGDMADAWRHDSDWLDWKLADDHEWWTQVATSGMTNFATSNVTSMYKSQSSVMNWLLGNVYESPNGLGRGRYTAAAGNEMYHRQITEQFVQPAADAATDWAKRHGMANLGIPSQQAVASFNREVMLELNDRMLGRKIARRDPAVLKAADAYGNAGTTSVRIGQGEGGQKSIDGFEGLSPKDGYSPYSWQGRTVVRLVHDKVVDRQAIVDTMAQGYRAAGMPNTKDAKAVADAVLKRIEAEDMEIDTNLISLLSGDGREFLEQSLQRSGMPVAERDALMQRLTGKVEERGQEGFTKSRNDIDLDTKIPTLDGSDLKIVDLMDPDLHGVWQRYARRMAGAASLARVGITNKAHREEIIKAAQAQQRALGEEVTDADLLRAMFSHFNGGPVHGYSNLFGKHYEEGIMPEAALAKRMTNLALLGKLGFAQLAETGASMAAVGLETWMKRGPLAAFDAELKAGNKAVLSDIAFITGDLGMDHKMFAEHLDLDDMNATDRGQFTNAINTMSQKATYLQSAVSGFNAVRGHQQRIVAAGITDKIFRSIKDGAVEDGNIDDAFRRRMRIDFGLFDEDLMEMEQLISNGTIEFKTVNGFTFVDRINPQKWDADQRLRFGAAITRGMNQTVQKSMAGEQDAWMHTTLGSLFSHLKTFPMQAIQKQAIRNLRHSDPQALQTLYMGMATAGVAIMVRDALDGKDRSLGETARAAFGYSNLTGWVPMAVDPALTILGMEDLRFNQYGPHSDLTPPTLDWLNRSMRLPGAVSDTLTGNADYQDRQSMKALPFANVIGLSRITD